MSKAFTVVIAGDSGTGKTSLILRMAKDIFQEALDPTVIGTMTPVYVDVDSSKVRLNIWDTSGTEDYQSMNMRHFADAQCCIFVFSIDNPISPKNIISNWYPSFLENSRVPCIPFIIGNKTDLSETMRSIATDDIEQLEQHIGCRSYMASALTGAGVKEILTQIAESLVKKTCKKELEEEFDPVENSKRNNEIDNIYIDDVDVGCKCNIF